jgi:hypothetical protein
MRYYYYYYYYYSSLSAYALLDLKLHVLRKRRQRLDALLLTEV